MGMNLVNSKSRKSGLVLGEVTAAVVVAPMSQLDTKVGPYLVVVLYKKTVQPKATMLRLVYRLMTIGGP
jgi:hypothetical protein